MKTLNADEVRALIARLPWDSSNEYARETFREIQKELLAFVELTRWRPIATAPKDTPMLVIANARPIVVPIVARWTETLGWGCVPYSFQGERWSDLTHWAPIPPLPEKE